VRSSYPFDNLDNLDIAEAELPVAGEKRMKVSTIVRT